MLAMPEINHIKKLRNDKSLSINEISRRTGLLRLLIKEIQVNTGEKPKDRTIKKIVYEFDQKLFKEINNELV
ncbi:hypothetical protein ACFPTR_06200 [Aliibacillus thermotolerans]|uniref:Transcriptional regulator n=1 Tax=Aliibacillus thermotolerans TaxID=1834418 RepID=A0ABW0U6V2_9BACI|nr:hypothetical protein [Aliibacillus thermotolerans]MDA3129470.1 hypothetical protein [Aliibacillus thermotolerans]